MLLLIDAGNTRIKWALLDASQTVKLGDWVKTGSLSHQEWKDGINQNAPMPWEPFSIQRVIVSNVAGSVLQNQLLHFFQEKNHVVEWFISKAKRAGINNQYRNPAQLGSDRFAAAIGAHALFPKQTLIIALCGTALTIDTVTAQGDFIGGMIAPGLQLMAQSLAQNTAQLLLSKDNTIKTCFANHTEAAIASGCLAAQVGAIEHASRLLSITTGVQPLCIISGGAAKYVIPNLDIPSHFVDNLVLIGLQVIS